MSDKIESAHFSPRSGLCREHVEQTTRNQFGVPRTAHASDTHRFSLRKISFLLILCVSMSPFTTSDPINCYFVFPARWDGTKLVCYLSSVENVEKTNGQRQFIMKRRLCMTIIGLSRSRNSPRPVCGLSITHPTTIRCIMQTCT